MASLEAVTSYCSKVLEKENGRYFTYSEYAY